MGQAMSIFQMKSAKMCDWVITFPISLLLLFFENAKVWVGRTTLNGCKRRKKGRPNLRVPFGQSNSFQFLVFTIKDIKYIYKNM